MSLEYHALYLLLRRSAGREQNNRHVRGAPVGPQLGYYLNGKISDGDGNEEDIEDGDVQKLELGYAAAVGYQTEMGLTVEARFSGGINSIAKDDAF